MPKLKTAQFGYRTKRAKDLVHFSILIKVSQDGEFYCKASEIPEAIQRSQRGEVYDWETGNVGSRTLVGLYQKINEFIEKHEALLETQGRTKVILYRILMQGDLTPELGGSEKGSKRHNDIDHDDCDLGLGLTWDVVWKTTMLGSTQYNYGNGTQYRGLYKQQEIPWTEAREAWFEQLSTSLRGMLLRIDAFFDGLEPEGLIAHIDSGLTALPPPEKKEDEC